MGLSLKQVWYSKSLEAAILEALGVSTCVIAVDMPSPAVFFNCINTLCTLLLYSLTKRSTRVFIQPVADPLDSRNSSTSSLLR